MRPSRMASRSASVRFVQAPCARIPIKEIGFITSPLTPTDPRWKCAAVMAPERLRIVISYIRLLSVIEKDPVPEDVETSDGTSCVPFNVARNETAEWL